eukprot:678210-Rhodomonas_salina.2
MPSRQPSDTFEAPGPQPLPFDFVKPVCSPRTAALVMATEQCTTQQCAHLRFIDEGLTASLTPSISSRVCAHRCSASTLSMV